MIRNARQASEFLQRLVLTEPRSYSERAAVAQRAVAALLARLDNPERQLTALVHIAGSKGKGSVALLLETALGKAGWRVGTFTSPHLWRWNERLRIDGRPISDARFTTLLESIRPAVEDLLTAAHDQRPSFFDTLTAAALRLFAQQRLDCVIIETGLGGRFDATAIVQPTVCCITSIELEHVDKLGSTLEAIAAHKAGIIKPGVPVVVGRLPPQALAVIEREATAQHAPLVRLDHELRLLTRPSSTPLDGCELWLSSTTARTHSVLPLLGPAAAVNAALALGCALRLGAPLPDNSLANAKLPGRLELINREPLIIIDSAHTADSARGLRALLDQIATDRPVQWLLSFSQGKNPVAICRFLLRQNDAVTLTQAESQRSQAPITVLNNGLRQLLAQLSVEPISEPDPRRAIGLALAHQRRHNGQPLVIAGSVYIAGLARQVLPAHLGKSR